MNYGLAQAIGFHPWEDLHEHAPFANKLMELVAREEDEYGPPYGPQLDQGTAWWTSAARRTAAALASSNRQPPAAIPTSSATPTIAPSGR